MGLATIFDSELPADLGGLGAEHRLVQFESVGQGPEGNTLEIIRVQGPEKSDGTPTNMRVGVKLGEVGPFDDLLRLLVGGAPGLPNRNHTLGPRRCLRVRCGGSPKNPVSFRSVVSGGPKLHRYRVQLNLSVERESRKGVQGLL